MIPLNEEDRAREDTFFNRAHKLDQDDPLREIRKEFIIPSRADLKRSLVTEESR